MNKKTFTMLTIMLFCALLVRAKNGGISKSGTSSSPGEKLQAGIGVMKTMHNNKPALQFIENKGQVIDQHGNPNADVDFKMDGGNVQLFLGAGKIQYQWAEQANKKSGLNEQSTAPTSLATEMKTYRMEVTLLNANQAATVIKEEQQAYFEQYLGTRQPAIAHAYKKITYRDIYPHIDWVFYFNEDQKLEHDFIIHPGGKVSDIKIKYDGARDLKINKDGSLTATTLMGRVSESAPYSYVQDGAVIASSFELKNDILSFKTGAYRGTLIIDPTLDWGTWYGGGHQEFAQQIASDREGNVYLAGLTQSLSGIATTNGYQQTLSPGFIYADMNARQFLVKFDSTGQRLWSTYYGSSKDMYTVNNGFALNTYEKPRIACDPFGNVYMLADSSLVKFSTGGQMIWQKGVIGSYSITSVSAYPPYDTTIIKNIGGSTFGYADLECDADGNVYMSGLADKNLHGTPGTHQDTVAGGTDVFLIKLDSSGSQLWGTYFGGPGSEYLASAKIACDPWNNIFLTGSTTSTTGIASPGSFQSTLDVSGRSFFLAKFNPSGILSWSTYYVGTGISSDIATDTRGNVFLVGGITGVAPLTGWATPGAFLETRQGGYSDWADFIVAKFDSSGQRQWATYFGGDDMEMYDGNSQIISCDSFGNVYLGGITLSTLNIATSNAFQENKENGAYVPFLTKFDPEGKQVWGTYLGGAVPVDQLAFSQFSDKHGHLYVAGTVSADQQSSLISPDSFNLITPNCFQPAFGILPVSGPPPARNIFLAKFTECGLLKPDSLSGDTAFCANGSYTLRVSPVNGASSYTWLLPNGWTGSSSADSIAVTVNGNSGMIGVVAQAFCSSDTLWQHITIHPLPQPLILQNGSILHTGSFSTYQWNFNGQPLSGAQDSSLSITVDGAYSVTVTDSNGCSATSPLFNVTNLGIADNSGIAAAIKIYPNPTDGKIILIAPVKVNVVLSSIDGKTLLEQENATHIDIGAYAEGLYLLKIMNIKGSLLKIEKIIKTRK